MPVAPAALTLDDRAGKDAAVPGRLTTVAVKRRAAALAATLGGDFETLWLRLHGPAFGDATGDNGFWLRWFLAHAPAVPSQRGTDRHLTWWSADDPVAVALAAMPPSATVELTRIGPLLAARYAPTIDYDACQADGVAVAVPIRVTPDPRRYGDGTPALPRTLPVHLACALRAASTAETRIVAALGGDGTVVLAVDGLSTPPAPTAALCAPAGERSVQLTIVRPAAAPAELDLYDVPLAIGCDEPVPRVTEH
jgi:hypothetical protein